MSGLDAALGRLGELDCVAVGEDSRSSWSGAVGSLRFLLAAELDDADTVAGRRTEEPSATSRIVSMPNGADLTEPPLKLLPLLLVWS